MRKPVSSTTSTTLHRQSGVALWRQIADRIQQSVIPAVGGSGAKLPSEQQLATEFGVNRHTVRAAISALVREGVLRAEQGRGTFVDRPRRITYPISRRTRFSRAVDGQAEIVASELLAQRREAANDDVASALRLAAGVPVIRLETLGRADGTPISRGTSWFDPDRFSGIGEALTRSGSLTAAMAEHGVTDYWRLRTIVEARHASPDDQETLALSPGAIVFITRYVNCDENDTPVQYAVTRFPADRVEMQFDTSDRSAG